MDGAVQWTSLSTYLLPGRNHPFRLGRICIFSVCKFESSLSGKVSLLKTLRYLFSVWAERLMRVSTPPDNFCQQITRRLPCLHLIYERANVNWFSLLRKSSFWYKLKRRDCWMCSCATYIYFVCFESLVSVYRDVRRRRNAIFVLPLLMYVEVIKILWTKKYIYEIK